MSIVSQIDISAKDISADFARFNLHHIESFADDSIALLRVSTQEQAINGYSLQAQRIAIAQALQCYGKRIIDTVNEEANCGRSLRRETLLRAVSLAKAHKCSISVDVLDRLLRPWPPTLAQLETIAAFEVPFVSIKPLSLEPTPYRGERVMRSIDAKRALDAGQLFGCPVYLNLDALSLIIDRLGDTWSSIARALNAAGIPTKAGKQWNHTGVRRFFENHFTYVDFEGCAKGSRHVDHVRN